MTVTDIQKMTLNCERMLKRIDIAFSVLPSAEIKLKTEDAKEIYILLDKFHKVLEHICNTTEVDVG